MISGDVWRRNFPLLVLLALSVGLELAWHSYVGFVRDDAFITFRFAENIAAGKGFVYNPGEPVYGTTSPGLALLLAAYLVIFPQGHAIDAALALDVLACTILLLLLWRLLQKLIVSGPQRALVLVLLVWSDKSLLHSMEGMEAPLVIACMLGSLFWLLNEKPIPAAAAAGAMLWFRADSALWIVAMAIVCGLRWRRNTVVFLLLTVLMYLPWLLFAWLYFGSPIPLTAIAKQIAYSFGRLPWAGRLGVLFSWMTPFSLLVAPAWVRVAAWTTLLISAFGAWSYRQHVLVQVLILFFLTESAALIALNMTVEQRYMFSSLYVLLILFALGLLAVAGRGPQRPGLTLKFAVLLGIYAPLAIGFALPRIQHLRDYQRYVYDLSLQQMGIWLLRNTPSDSVVYLEPLGYVGDYSGRTMLDDVGLATPAVVPMKQAGWNSFQIVSVLKPNYVILHCDDARRAPPAFGYGMRIRFDPLGYAVGAAWEDKPLQRSACYGIYARDPTP
jgi:hypothetical protein